jgi:hypothetical protein
MTAAPVLAKHGSRHVLERLLAAAHTSCIRPSCFCHLLLAFAGAEPPQLTSHQAGPAGSSSRGAPQQCRTAQLGRLAHAARHLAVVFSHLTPTRCQLLVTEQLLALGP